MCVRSAEQIARLSHLLEGRADIIVVHALADALATAAPGRLEHDRVADLLSALQGLLDIVNACLHTCRRAQPTTLYDNGTNYAV